MLTDLQREHTRLATRTMQIIAGAMAAGVLFFAVIVLVMGNRGGAPPNAFLTYMAVGFAGLAIVLWIVVPNVVVGQMRVSIIHRDTSRLPLRNMPNAAELGDVAPLSAAYQTRLIIGSALLEGAAFFCLIAYMIEAQPIALAATGVVLLLLLSQIPSTNRVEAWIESELATIEQLRGMRRSH